MWLTIEVTWLASRLVDWYSLCQFPVIGNFSHFLSRPIFLNFKTAHEVRALSFGGTCKKLESYKGLAVQWSSRHWNILIRHVFPLTICLITVATILKVAVSTFHPKHWTCHASRARALWCWHAVCPLSWDPLSGVHTSLNLHGMTQYIIE